MKRIALSICLFFALAAQIFAQTTAQTNSQATRMALDQLRTTGAGILIVVKNYPQIAALGNGTIVTESGKQPVIFFGSPAPTVIIGATPVPVDAETPNTFKLAPPAQSGKVAVWRNGLRLTPAEFILLAPDTLRVPQCVTDDTVLVDYVIESPSELPVLTDATLKGSAISSQKPIPNNPPK